MRGPISRTALTLNYLFMILVTSTCLILGTFQFINLLGIKFFYDYSPKIINLIIFTPAVDSWIWASSLLIIICEVILSRALRIFSLSRWPVIFSLFLIFSLFIYLFNAWWGIFLSAPIGIATAVLSLYYGFGATSKPKTFAIVLCSVIGFLLFFELSALLTWTWNIVDYQFPFSSFTHWRFALFDMQLFNVFYPWIALFFVVLLYGWLWVPLVKTGFSKISSLRRLGERLNQSSSFSSGTLSLRMLLVGLLFSVVVGIFVAYYPWVHLSGSTLAGSDSINYYNWMQDMAHKGPSFAWQTDRPVVLLLLYGLQHVSGLSPEGVVRVVPMFCAAGLCLSVFWFVRTGLKNDRIAVISAFFSVVSFQLTVSISAYSLANWIAIIEWFVVLVFLLKSFEKRSVVYALGASFFGVILLLTHPYTWDIFMVVLLFYAIGTLTWAVLKKKTVERFEILVAILVLTINFIFFEIYGLFPFAGGVTGGSSGVTGNILPGAALAYVPGGLLNMIQSWVSGAFAEPILLIFAVIGLFYFMDFSKRFNRLLILLVAVPSLILLKVSPEGFLYYRLVYLVPVEILAAAGFYWLINRVGDWIGSENSKMCQIIKFLLVALVILFFLNYALRLADSVPLVSV